MLSFALRRVVLGLLVLAIISVVVFVVCRAIPGDIINRQLEDAGAVTAELLAEKRTQLGLDQPVLTQFALWAGNVLRGDLGRSLWSQRPVSDDIARVLLPTLQLSITAILLGSVLGVAAGSLSAIRRGSVSDMVVRVGATLFLAIPQLWLALLTLTGLAAINYYIPLPYRSFAANPLANFQQIIFPAAALALGVAAALARLTRSSMLEIIGADFIRAAHARGVSPTRAHLQHGLRNALIPILTLLGTQFGNLLSGTVIIERIFNVPGLGNFLFEAVASRDYPAIQGAVLVYGVITITVNLLVDLSYGWVDPRVRSARS